MIPGRIDRVRAATRDAGASACFVRSTADIRWATAFSAVFDTEQAHALLVTPLEAALHTDSRYAQAARRAAGADDALACSGESVAIDDSLRTHAAFAAARLAERGSCGHAAGAAGGEAADAAGPAGAFCEGLAIPYDIALNEYRSLQRELPRASLIEAKDLILNLRAVKDDAEIAALQAAQDIADAAFAWVVDFIRPGRTEREVQVALENRMVELGAEGLSFSSIVACGENGANPHAIPGVAVLRQGQAVVIDFGCVKNGYCSDMTRTVFLGKPNSLMARAYAAIREANERVEAALRPGVTGAAMHDLAEQVLAEHGFAGKMGHGLGHGVGLQVHELPNLNRRNEKPLVAGNVVTVEPGIYLAAGDGLLAGAELHAGDGLLAAAHEADARAVARPFAPFGMRLEDFGVITADGFRVFTQTSHDAVII